jgi:hypothetical protein
LANVAKVDATDARRLASFVAQGGGLAVFAGENVQADGYAVLDEAGISIGQVTGTEPATSLPWRIQSWEREHPVFRPFDDPEYGDLRRLAFRAYTRIEPSQGTRVLARFRDGGPAVLEREHGRGKVLWFASACDRQWSDWPRSRLFVPMVHQMLGYLTGLAEGGPVRSVVLGQDRTHQQDLLPGVVDRGGYWEVVNVDPRESEMDRSSRQEFADRFGLMLQTEEEHDTAAQRTAATAELRADEIWHWVILGLLVVLLAECFLANRTPA